MRQRSLLPATSGIRLASPALFILLAGMLLSAGCRERPATVPAGDASPLVADTTGVHVINDTAASWGTGTPWTIGVVPTFDVGQPLHPLLGVPAPVWLSDGRIVVANASKQEILYFDPQGKLLLTAGGRGVEEGQFHGLGWIGLAPADTIVAYDFVSNRLSLFDPKGHFVRSVGLPVGGAGSSAEPIVTYPDGSLLVRVGGAAGPFIGKAGEVRRDSASYVRVGLDGILRATLGTFPQSETFGVMAHGKQGVTSAFPVPFGLYTTAAVRGDTTLVGTGSSFEVASLGPTGAPVGLLRVAISRPVVTPAEQEEFTRSAISRLRTASTMMKTPLDSSLLVALGKAPFPAKKPAFGRLQVDVTGALWVSAPLTPPLAPTSWNVFAPDGAWLGSVTTPAGFRVDVIGRDAMLGVWRATNGEERVQVFPVFRGPAS
jgi:hypothetical protein